MQLLPKNPDEKVLQLLIRAKMFLDHAVSHANNNSSFDRMIAIHNLDNCVEYILRIIIRHVEFEDITGKNLETCELGQLAGELNKFLKEKYSIELPYLSEIKLLRQLRNLVQHAMVDPATDLPRFINIGQRFFSKVMINIFDTKFAEIKISNLITNTDLKGFLVIAEELIEQKKYLEAIISCRDAFENARFYRKVKSSLNLDLVPALLETKNNMGYLYVYLKQMNNELELERLGVESRLYNRFNDYLSHIPSEYCVDRNGHSVMQRPWVKDDAEYCYSFVSNIIFKWEQEQLEPLYEIKIDPTLPKHSRVEYLGDVELKAIESGCEYFLADNDRMKYFFVDKESKNEIIAKLRTGNIYEHKSSLFEDGLLKSIFTEYVELVSLSFDLITNNPERWEISLWLKLIPLTFINKGSKEYIDISRAKIDELIEHDIPSNIAEIIVYPWKHAKVFSKMEHARNIKEALKTIVIPTSLKSFMVI